MDDEDNKLMVCPERLIPQSVLEFWEVLKYEDRFKNAPLYHARNSKFIDALYVYEHALGEARAALDPKSDGTLKSLRQSWHKKTPSQ